MFVLDVKTKLGWRQEMQSVDRQVVADTRESMLAVFPCLRLRIRRLA